MGIRGLSSYMKNAHLHMHGKTLSAPLWTSLQLQDTKVIMDGKAFLYFIQGKIDCSFGGQYDRIAHCIDVFFSCFKAKNIEAYVVFDGPEVTVDKKLQTLIEREENKIEKCANLSQGKSGETVDAPLTLPLLVRKLQDLQIPFTVCDGEADNEIAVLSKQRNCPVISYDSDFFIYDTAGYIPLPYITYSESLVNVHIYHRDRVAQCLEINEALLPLLASLLGNDYVNDDVLRPLYRKLKVESANRHDKIECIRRHLSQYQTLNEAMESALHIISTQKEREALKAVVTESVDQYDTTGSSVSDLTSQLEDTIIDDIGIPGYVVKRYRRGHFPVRYMGALRKGKQILKSQVECHRTSSNQCSLKLRQIMYGIVSPGREEVLEWDRNGRNLKEYKVQPVVNISDRVPVPNLKTLEELGEEKRRKLLHTMLESNEAIQSLPESQQLFAASVRYWIRHSILSPAATKRHPKILLLQYFQDKKFIEGSDNLKTDPLLLHDLAQWQSVMAEALHLNQILLDALPEPDLSRIFNGLTAQIIKEELSKGSTIKPPEEMKAIYEAIIKG